MNVLNAGQFKFKAKDSTFDNIINLSTLITIILILQYIVKGKF
jgi:hypothetical protein